MHLINQLNHLNLEQFALVVGSAVSIVLQFADPFLSGKSDLCSRPD